MRSTRVIASLLFGLLAHACVPVPIPGKAGPDTSDIKEKATRAEIETELGPPAECGTLETEWELCTYSYRHSKLVWSWIGIAPPYIPLFDPTVWKAQHRHKVGILYGSDDKAVRVFLLYFSTPDRLHSRAVQKAECGIAEAQYQLGFDFEHGLGVSEDRAQAYFWYSAAAQQDHKDAKAALNRMARKVTASELTTAERLSAEWKPRDCEKELQVLKQRAVLGDVEAQWLAYMNPGLSEHERLTWLCRAADQGHQASRMELARRYWFGSSQFPEDRGKAQMWLILAAKDDGQFATNQMHAHASKLSEAQIGEAQELAAHWKPGDCETELQDATVRLTN